MPSEHEARILLRRVTHLRELVIELEIDSDEWSCDSELRRAFTKAKCQLEEAALLLALLQPMRKH